jgi:hypothetical protein
VVWLTLTASYLLVVWTVLGAVRFLLVATYVGLVIGSSGWVASLRLRDKS